MITAGQLLCLKKWGQGLLHWEPRKLAGVWESSDSHTDKSKWCGQKVIEVSKPYSYKIATKDIFDSYALIIINAMFETNDHRWIFHHTASRGAEKGRDRSQISPFYLGFVGFIFGYFFFQNWFYLTFHIPSGYSMKLLLVIFSETHPQKLLSFESLSCHGSFTIIIPIATCLFLMFLSKIHFCCLFILSGNIDRQIHIKCLGIFQIPPWSKWSSACKTCNERDTVWSLGLFCSQAWAVSIWLGFQVRQKLLFWVVLYSEEKEGGKKSCS